MPADHVHAASYAVAGRNPATQGYASRGQASRDLLGVLDGQYYSVVLAVGQVDDDPGFVAVAEGERDALVLMEAPHPDARKLRARPFQAVNFGNAVRTARTPLTALRGNV
jgi:hypothetical protein